jgi:hypothetical protein
MLLCPPLRLFLPRCLKWKAGFVASAMKSPPIALQEAIGTVRGASSAGDVEDMWSGRGIPRMDDLCAGA